MIENLIGCGEWGGAGRGLSSHNGMDMGGWTYKVCPGHNQEITYSNSSIMYQLIQMHQDMYARRVRGAGVNRVGW